jgi:hypothetical protein
MTLDGIYPIAKKRNFPSGRFGACVLPPKIFWRSTKHFSKPDILLGLHAVVASPNWKLLFAI